MPPPLMPVVAGGGDEDDGTSLVEVLEEAQRRGFMGPGPVLEQRNHARALASGLGQAPTGPALDLGSGGGIPGLVLALAWPDSRWVLLDANGRRTTFLDEAVRVLGLEHRVVVVTGRAEEVGRLPAHRGAYHLVVARSFARPPVVAECAAPLLRLGGTLAVSEPPEGRGRWPADGLAALGLRLARAVSGSRWHLAILSQDQPCPDRFPRRTGIPEKRPLW